MAITKNKKKDILEKLKKEVTDKESVVFVNFKGLPVNETAEIRRKLGESNVSYFVAKKTLIKKAFGETKIEGEIPNLDGELALAYANDLIAPAREIYSFQKKYADKINILGGVFENKYFSKSQMEEIAKIPSHHTLKGMFVNVINSPIQGLVLALNAIAEKQNA
jgi:large subunit ribosomal protein L10